MRIQTYNRFSTTPRPKTSIPYTPIQSVQTNYDKTLPDDGLTKQIYDRAVEVYHATNRAIDTAVEALSSLELNRKTFEPLLADSLLFMLGLGLFVMTLVLTMMLVVYVVDKRIQPRVMDDDISIF